MAWNDSKDSHHLVAMPGAANGTVFAVALQADGKIVIGGNFSTVNNATRNRLARLNATGATGLDSTFAPLTGVVPASTVRCLAIQADGKILVGGDSAPRLVRLNADGTQDAAFTPAPNNIVRAIAIQSDGKIIVAGDFTSIAATTVSRIARLNSDGTIDNTFVAASGRTLFIGSMNALAIQGDGMVLVGGTGSSSLGFRFDRIYSATIAKLWRLNNVAFQIDLYVVQTVSGTGYSQLFNVATSSSGTGTGLLLDIDVFGVNDGHINDVRVAVGDGTKYGSGYGLGESITPLAGGNDGAMSVSGSNGSPTTGVDGIDQSFAPNPNNNINAIAIQSDGKVIVGGTFTGLNVDGSTHARLARLNTDGSVDATFTPSFAQTVNAIAIQSDGKIIVGSGAGSARLNADGTTDKSFSTQVFAEFNATWNGTIQAIAVQADGKIVLGGSIIAVPFSTTASWNVMRLNADCTMDLGFNPGPGADSIAGLQGNGLNFDIATGGVNGLWRGSWDNDFFLDPTVGFSFTLNFKRTSTGSNSESALFRIMGKNGTFDLKCLFTTTPALALTYNDGAGHTKTITLTPTSNAFHFLRVWVDPADLRIYLEIDRTDLIATGHFAAIATVPAMLAIYRVNNGGIFVADEGAFYRGKITDANADTLYNNGAPPAYPNVPGA